MCGIAGIFAHHGDAPEVSRDELLRTRDAMAPRGPDDAGDWVSGDLRVGLAHRRLAIIDLSPSGHQPMASLDGSCTIVFNGEIYNYRELRASLEAEGVRFRSSSDTEVILALYMRHGVSTVARLRGMFAFALWDGRERRLLLARDPFGIKPLYWSNSRGVFRFASQVKALLAGGGVSAAADPAGAAGFFLWGSVPEPLTMLGDVRAVRAGHVLTVDGAGCGEERPFFSIARLFSEARRLGPLAAGSIAPEGLAGNAAAFGTRSDSPGAGALEEEARAAFLDSIRHHLIADVEVGAFLSAGIDSTAVVALASEISPSPLRTVTLAFEEFRDTPLDEAPIAEETARRLGTRHETRTISRRRFLDAIPDLLRAMDQPSIDGVNTYFVSQVTAEAGLKVAMSGLGGDELLGGYATFRDLPWLVRGAAIPSRVPGLGRAARPLLSAAIRGRLPGRYAGALELGGSWAGAYVLRRGLFATWELPEILGEEQAREGLRGLDLLGEIRRTLDPDPGSAFARVSALESSHYMRNQLLRDSDWASMAHSLELRVPLVDPPLWSRLARWHGRFGRSRGKDILARATRPPLPETIVHRPKTGFSVPVWSWVSGSPGLDGWRRIPALNGPGNQGARRWAYTVFEALVPRALRPGERVANL